jgi:hypothetical protein
LIQVLSHPGKAIFQILQGSLMICAALALCACASLSAPRYTPALENVQKLSDAGVHSVQVNAFTVIPGHENANPILLRGAPLASPYHHSYADYLTEALREEFQQAGKLSARTGIIVSGTLQKNWIDLPGLGPGAGELQARFIVTQGGTVRYDQLKFIHDEWNSSFVGKEAIPRAQSHYPLMMQRLLASLYADPDFVMALK